MRHFLKGGRNELIKMEKENSKEEYEKKTIKVDLDVYTFISNELRKGESFSDGLKRILGLYPNLDMLMSYFAEHTREDTLKMIELTRSLGNLKEEIVQKGDDFELNFIPRVAPEIPVVRVRFSEGRAMFDYKNMEGKFKNSFKFFNNKKDRISEKEMEEWEQEVRGAVRRWCRDRADEVLKDDSR